MTRERKLPQGMWKRGHVYYARLSFKGDLVRQKLSSDFRVACEMLTELKQGVYHREKCDISNDLEIEKLSEDWLRSIGQSLESSTVLRYRQNVANLLKVLCVHQVSQLDLDVIDTFRADRLQQNVGAQTVNKDVGALRTMLNWAVVRKRIGSNPIIGVKPLPETPKEARALRPDEVQALLAASTPHWREIWYAYLTTGLRKMELANLLFTDIDWSARELIIRASTAKNKTPRRIPIDNHLFDIISRQQELAGNRFPGSWANKSTTARIQGRFTCDHIFVTTACTPLGGNIYRGFVADCTRAEIITKTRDAKGNIIEIVDLHSTRHTFATDLILNGADPKTVQTLMGHKTLDMTMRIYAKIFAQQKHAAIGKLSYGAGVTITEQQANHTQNPGHPPPKKYKMRTIGAHLKQHTHYLFIFHTLRNTTLVIIIRVSGVRIPPPLLVSLEDTSRQTTLKLSALKGLGVSSFTEFSSGNISSSQIQQELTPLGVKIKYAAFCIGIQESRINRPSYLESIYTYFEINVYGEIYTRIKLFSTCL